MKNASGRCAKSANTTSHRIRSHYSDHFKSHDFEYYWKWSDLSAEPSITISTHKDEVTDLKITEDTKTMFSVGRDSLLKMFNFLDGKQERSVSLSRTALSRIVLLEDGNTAIVGSDCSMLV